MVARQVKFMQSQAQEQQLAVRKILIIQPVPKKVKIKSVLTPNKSVGAQF